MVWSKLECQNQLFQGTVKGENILEGSQDLIPSPSVKIQIMSYKGKKIAGCCQNKLLKPESLLTSTSNVLPY